jgi:hypothetical protein
MSVNQSQRNHGKTPKQRRTRGATKITPEQMDAIQKELELLPDLIRTHYTKWTNGAKDFQLECMGAQKLGKEVLLHAATGAGKTGITAGPHLLPSSKGKVTLMVSPLLSLHDEQVRIFFFKTLNFRSHLLPRCPHFRPNSVSRRPLSTAQMVDVPRTFSRYAYNTTFCNLFY